MRLITIMLISVILSSFIANALEINEQEISDNLDKVDLSKTPGVLKFILGKPRVNIEIEDKGEVYGFKISGNKIKEFKVGGIDKPNYVVSLSEENLESIVNASDPFIRAEELYLNKEINVTPKTYGSKIKYFFGSKIIKLKKV